MIYSVEFSPVALKQFGKLEKDIQERIKSALERARLNPFLYFFKMTGIDFYRMRVGDYRVLADVQQEKVIILVVKVGNRKNVYDSI